MYVSHLARRTLSGKYAYICHYIGGLIMVYVCMYVCIAFGKEETEWEVYIYMSLLAYAE